MSQSGHSKSSGLIENSASTPQQTRRRACEHCRTQKLKCIRDDNFPSGSCFRCVDAHKDCVTDSRRRVGRPPRSVIERQRRGSLGVAPCARNQRANEISSCAVQGSFENDEPWSVDDFTLDLLPEHLYELANLPDNIFNPSFSFDPSETSSNLDQDGVILGSTSTDRNSTRTSQSLGTDPDLQLLQLQQDLVNLIISLRKRDWDIVLTLRMEFSAREESVAFTDSMSISMDFNPLAETFELISRLDCLLLLKIQHLHHGSGTTPPVQTSSNQISSQYLLGVVSCYMQILSAYDCIVSYLLDEVSRNPSVKDFVLYGAPRITIAGILAPPLVNTLGRLLVRLFESRILFLESTLGLPDGARISQDTSGRYSITSLGLLGGVIGGKSILAMLADANLESEFGDGRSPGLRRLRERLDCLHSLE